MLVAALVVSTFGLQFADLGGAFSPMFFPRIILFMLLGLAALNVAIDFIGKHDAVPIRLLPVLGIGLSLLIHVLIMIPLGYFLSSVALGVSLLLCLGLRHPAQIIGIPLVGAGALLVLFNHVLKMPLPTSPFVWWL